MGIRQIVGIIIMLLFVAVFCMKKSKHKFKFNTRNMTITGVFAAISVILYLVPIFNISLFFFPGFLQIHLDEIPAFLVGYAYGPISSIIVILIKTLSKLPLTTTACVGEIADFIYSIVFVVPAAVIYKKKRSIKGALLSFLIGTICQLFVACFMTSFVMLNFYMNFMGISKEGLLQMCQVANPKITDLGFTFMGMVALPFNLLKDGVVFAITFILYKRIRHLINKLGQEKN